MPTSTNVLTLALKAHSAGDLVNARVLYRESLKYCPTNILSIGWLAVIEAQLKNYDAAELLFLRAISIDKNHPEFILNYANLLYETKRYEEALNYYLYVEKSLTTNSVLFCNLSACYVALNKPLLGVNYARSALRINPKDPVAWNNCANALKQLGEERDALDCFNKALRLKPDYFDAWCNRGKTLKTLRLEDRGLSSFETAHGLNPNDGFVRGLLMHTKFELCDWKGAHPEGSNCLSKFFEAGCYIPPFFSLTVFDNPQFHYLNARSYSESKYPVSTLLGVISRRMPKKKIRIGYFSADFYNHATAYLSAELFEIHDKNKFDTFGFSLGPKKNDEMQRRISITFTKFIDAQDKSDRELAQIARELEIDIAIDLTGYTRNSRPGIFSFRAAPIQVSYLGYPGTMGAQFIDYIIADHSVIPPENRPFFSEKVVYLPHSYQVNDSKRRISEKEFTRQEVGLPEGGFIFCCFNNNHKIMPEIFTCWMRILQATPGSVLWLLQDSPTAASNLRKEAEARGVEGNRLIFAQRMKIDEHLARQRVADLFIDTLPYNAHTTASDALWAGLPVLTCIGRSFAGRVASSLLNSIGLPELIAQSQEEYELKAIKLASRPEMLADIKRKLQNNRLTHPLFNTQMFVRHIEIAYQKMYQRYDEGLYPDHIYVNESESS